MVCTCFSIIAISWFVLSEDYYHLLIRSFTLTTWTDDDEVTLLGDILSRAFSLPMVTNHTFLFTISNFFEEASSLYQVDVIGTLHKCFFAHRKLWSLEQHKLARDLQGPGIDKFYLVPHPRQTSSWLLPLPKEIMRACLERCLKRQKTDLVWFFIPWTINIWISRVEEFQGYWFSTPHWEITVTLSGSSFAYNWLRFLSWHKVFAQGYRQREFRGIFST